MQCKIPPRPSSFPYRRGSPGRYPALKSIRPLFFPRRSRRRRRRWQRASSSAPALAVPSHPPTPADGRCLCPPRLCRCVTRLSRRQRRALSPPSPPLAAPSPPPQRSYPPPRLCRCQTLPPAASLPQLPWPVAALALLLLLLLLPACPVLLLPMLCLLLPGLCCRCCCSAPRWRFYAWEWSTLLPLLPGMDPTPDSPCILPPTPDSSRSPLGPPDCHFFQRLRPLSFSAKGPTVGILPAPPLSRQFPGLYAPPHVRYLGFCAHAATPVEPEVNGR